jgi:hypothetical protein
VPRRARPEQQIQKAVFDHLKWRVAPGVFAFHPANGGFRKPIEAAILKSIGVRAGVPDIIAIRDGRCFALELKAAGGRLTPAQRECHEHLVAAGAEVATATGIDEAIRQLTSWGLLRPDASNQTANLFSRASRRRRRKARGAHFAAKPEHNRRHQQ